MGLGSDADPVTTAQRWEAGNGRRRSRVAGFDDLHPWQLKVGDAGWPLGDRELQMRERKREKRKGRRRAARGVLIEVVAGIDEGLDREILSRS